MNCPRCESAAAKTITNPLHPGRSLCDGCGVWYDPKTPNLRQTGRTTRMLLDLLTEALKPSTKYRRFVLVAHSSNYGQHLRGMLLRVLSDLGVSYANDRKSIRIDCTLTHIDIISYDTAYDAIYVHDVDKRFVDHWCFPDPEPLPRSVAKPAIKPISENPHGS